MGTHVRFAKWERLLQRHIQPEAWVCNDSPYVQACFSELPSSVCFCRRQWFCRVFQRVLRVAESSRHQSSFGASGWDLWWNFSELCSFEFFHSLFKTLIPSYVFHGLDISSGFDSPDCSLTGHHTPSSLTCTVDALMPSNSSHGPQHWRLYKLFSARQQRRPGRA